MCAITKSTFSKAVLGSVLACNLTPGALSLRSISQASAMVCCLSPSLSYNLIVSIGKSSKWSSNINIIPGVNVLPPPAIVMLNFFIIYDLHIFISSFQMNLLLEVHLVPQLLEHLYHFSLHHVPFDYA